MKTIQHHAKQTPKRNTKTPSIKIRWNKVIALLTAVLAVALLAFGLKFILDQNDLNTIAKRTAALEKQLAEYRSTHANDILMKTIVAQADALAAGYEYEAALEVLKGTAAVQSETLIKEKIATYQNAIDSMVVYNGNVPFLFMHILANDTKIAFSKPDAVTGYISFSISTYEFKGILAELYNRGFVLVDFYDVFENKSGIMVRKPLKLPAGKKPLILMQDELAYPDLMAIDGYARGLVLQNGKILTKVLSASGVEETSEGDFVPIVESFIEEHPDFSYRGGRGILSLTGISGTLGYRLTNANEIESATKLADAIKAKGWIFASTSYWDSRDVFLNGITVAKLTDDFRLWASRIKRIVGPTTLFVSPYGNKLTGKNLEVVKSFGFNTFFTDGDNFNVSQSEGMLFISRIIISGESFKSQKDYFKANFFDVQSIRDPNRP